MRVRGRVCPQSIVKIVVTPLRGPSSLPWRRHGFSYVLLSPSKLKFGIVHRHPGCNEGVRVGPPRERTLDGNRRSILSVCSVFVKRKSSNLTGSDGLRD